MSQDRHGNKPVIRQHTTAIQLGPIPPPQDFEHYNQKLPGAADRILKMAESEAAHRHEMEKSGAELRKHMVGVGFRNELTGMIFGFLLGATVVACGVFLAHSGQPVPGTLLGTGGVVGLCAVFVYGTRINSRK